MRNIVTGAGRKGAIIHEAVCRPVALLDALENDDGPRRGRHRFDAGRLFDQNPAGLSSSTNTLHELPPHVGTTLPVLDVYALTMLT